MMKLFLASCAIAAVSAVTSASAATMTVTDVPSTTTFGTLSYTGNDSDIVGFYNGTTSETLAERFDSGDASYEANLLTTSFGIPPVSKLDGPDNVVGVSQIIGGYTYFTAKFGTSLGLFYNTTADAIEVSWIEGSSKECKDGGFGASLCGGISHYKFTSDTSVNVVPLPASGVLLLMGLAGLGLARRRAA